MPDPVDSRGERVAPYFPRPCRPESLSPFRERLALRPEAPYDGKVRLLVWRPDPPGQGVLGLPPAQAPLAPPPAGALAHVRLGLRLLWSYLADRPHLLMVVALPLAFAPLLWVFWTWVRGGASFAG